jgi:hypothetical protein
VRLGFEVKVWNNYYNDLEHCGLDGETPNEVLFKVTDVVA